MQANVNIWSEELLRLYGLQPGEFAGTLQAWVDCLIPEDREAARAAIENSVKRIFELEFRIRRRDNQEIRWMYGRGQVSFDDAGKPSQLFGINVDITERKQTLETLRETPGRYERQVRLFDGVASTTPDFVSISRDGFSAAQGLGQEPAGRDWQNLPRARLRAMAP